MGSKTSFGGGLLFSLEPNSLLSLCISFYALPCISAIQSCLASRAWIRRKESRSLRRALRLERGQWMAYGAAAAGSLADVSN